MRGEAPCNSEVIATRAKIVWMWLTGMSARQISRKSGASVTTVYRWIRRWQEEGTVATRPYRRRPRTSSWELEVAAAAASQSQPATSYRIMVAVTVTVVSASTVFCQFVGEPVQQLSGDVDEPVEQVGVDVGVMVGQVVEHHLTGCHLVLITTTQHSRVFSSINRYLSVGVEAGVVVEAGWVLSQDQLAQDHLLQRLWGDTRTTCRALIIDLTNNDKTESALRLAETSGLWKLSETRVVVVGGTAGVKDVLLHHSLRNTVHALYLAFHDLTLSTLPRHGNSRLKKVLPKEGVVNERVSVYRRCLYCNNGDMDVQFIKEKNLTSLIMKDIGLFHDQFQNLMGHTFQVTTAPYFPYMDYQRDSQEPGSNVTPKESVDASLINSLAAILNFTYEIREEPNKNWGVENDGIFDGMMGQLQREEKDFCTVAGPSPGRLKAIEYAKGYPSDMVTIISLRPSILPQYLSLIRPFAGELWMALLVSVVAWSIVIWVLQSSWQWMAGGPSVKYNTALLYGWGALLEQPPHDPSVSTSGQVLVGFWLVFCLIIVTGFRSSLIAHLTIQGKSLPIDTFEDLAQQSGWEWGTEAWLLKGVPLEYFSTHTDPVVKKIYRKTEAS
ncbi:Glutamate receptor ionotropic, kainate 1-like 1 [Homarus americanus]|uniref:Glutamate receptor ionotropic, kainate 1-like 1 n=1 Tax=Homarus americanus TaxID=6706 RepID=A0A8J5JVA1_HOMAM|nr:Glutamate receptor ionotropic, kainate 1-like 1 [Homarus americanus]